MGKTQKCSGNTKPRNRGWAITEWDTPVFNEKQMSYLIYGIEICPKTQKKHFQTFVRFYNAKTFEQVKKHFPTAHIEELKGSINENIAYCSKDGDFHEFGEKPAQGKRTDLMSYAIDISNGIMVDDIALENPNVYHQYGRTLHKLEELRMRKIYRNFMTKGIWLYGETGIGKSHQAFEDFHPDTHYILPNDKGWWDGYTQQETVIINDFRGFLSYDFLLQMIDKWPFYVNRRGRPPLPFLSKKVIITSSLSPKQVYHNRDDNDSIEQLLRRVEVIKLHKIN
jgi:hypothetical protein